jgi:hypothetical protein
MIHAAMVIACELYSMHSVLREKSKRHHIFYLEILEPIWDESSGASDEAQRC